MRISNILTFWLEKVATIFYMMVHIGGFLNSNSGQIIAFNYLGDHLKTCWCTLSFSNNHFWINRLVIYFCFMISMQFTNRKSSKVALFKTSIIQVILNIIKLLTFVVAGSKLGGVTIVSFTVVFVVTEPPLTSFLLLVSSSSSDPNGSVNSRRVISTGFAAGCTWLTGGVTASPPLPALSFVGDSTRPSRFRDPDKIKFFTSFFSVGDRLSPSSFSSVMNWWCGWCELKLFSFSRSSFMGPSWLSDL